MHKIVALLGFIILAVFCSVWQNVQIIEMGKTITEKQQVMDELLFKQRMLEVKIANLKSFDRIAQLSKEELGLSQASEYQVVYHKDKLFTKDVAPAGQALSKSSMWGGVWDDFIAVAEASSPSDS